MAESPTRAKVVASNISFLIREYKADRERWLRNVDRQQRRTDAEGNENAISTDVEVFEHVIEADVIRTMVSRRGSALVDLTWNGALGESVDIYRDGEMIATTDNDGRYRDRFSVSASSVTYKICQTSSTLCSDPLVAQF